MADRETRLISAEKSLIALREVASKPADPVVQRDVTLFRFMLAAETTWKAAQVVLLELHGFDERSPKGVARAALQVWQLGPADAQLAIQLFDDRNLIVHTYNESLADEIVARVPAYLELLQRWVDALRGRFDPRVGSRLR